MSITDEALRAETAEALLAAEREENERLRVELAAAQAELKAWRDRKGEPPSKAIGLETAQDIFHLDRMLEHVMRQKQVRMLEAKDFAETSMGDIQIEARRDEAAGSIVVTLSLVGRSVAFALPVFMWDSGGYASRKVEHRTAEALRSLGCTSSGTAHVVARMVEEKARNLLPRGGGYKSYYASYRKD